MTLRAVLDAFAPGPRGTGRPVRVWPADESVWLRENGARRPRAARHVLRALASLGPRGRYEAHTEHGAKILTGPVSTLALPDAEAEIRFVFRITPLGYGETAF
ncbi:hypothetical protein MKL09_11870 [Methylobacterium sp. J-048]|uniref:hypothetical protein n=1 Tax=Methylobacterium sp. J-048 TaxID=2836635 RepID=UPI001FBA9FF3|nr:hypothetical protein [Methylobacterium sp. J-048]MCJ2057251.1 hypothetical protein [Methylobacterium sp. J-048]